MKLWLLVCCIILAMACSSKKKTERADGKAAGVSKSKSGADASDEKELDIEDILESKPVEAHEGSQNGSVDYSKLKEAVQRDNAVEVLEASSAILSQKKEDITALNTLAMYHYKKGQIGIAKTILQRAFKQREDSPVLYNNLGIILLREGKTRDATAAFKRALKGDEKQAAALANLAGVYAKYGDFEKAIQQFENLSQVSPIADLSEEMRLAFSVALWKAGRKDKAKTEFEELYKVGKNTRMLFAYSVFLLDEFGATDLAQEVFSRLKQETLSREMKTWVAGLEKKFSKKKDNAK